MPPGNATFALPIGRCGGSPTVRDKKITFTLRILCVGGAWGGHGEPFGQTTANPCAAHAQPSFGKRGATGKKLVSHLVPNRNPVDENGDESG